MGFFAKSYSDICQNAVEIGFRLFFHALATVLLSGIVVSV